MARTRREVKSWPTVLRELTVTRIVDVTLGMRRITLSGDQLGSFDVAGGAVAPFESEGFDDHVKLLVPMSGQDRPPLPVQGPDRLEWGSAGGRPVAKDYTPRRFDRATLELDLDFVRHGAGFAASWAERTEPGESAWIVGPTRSLLTPTGVDCLFVAGDETALPAIGRLLEHWPTGVPGQVVIEVSRQSHRQDVPVPAGVTISWAGSPDDWVSTIEELPWPQGETFCWVAGETSTVRRVRNFLKSERMVGRENLDVTGYWRR